MTHQPDAPRFDEPCVEEVLRCGQIQVLVAGIEQGFGVGHDGTMNLEQIGKKNAQNTGGEHAQQSAGGGRDGTFICPVNKEDDNKG